MSHTQSYNRPFYEHYRTSSALWWKATDVSRRILRVSNWLFKSFQDSSNESAMAASEWPPLLDKDRNAANASSISLLRLCEGENLAISHAMVVTQF